VCCGNGVFSGFWGSLWGSRVGGAGGLVWAEFAEIRLNQITQIPGKRLIFKILGGDYLLLELGWWVGLMGDGFVQRFALVTDVAMASLYVQCIVISRLLFYLHLFRKYFHEWRLSQFLLILIFY